MPVDLAHRNRQLLRSCYILRTCGRQASGLTHASCWATISNHEERNVIELAGAFCELFDRGEYAVFKIAQSGILMPAGGFHETLVSERIVVSIFGFGYTIGEQHQRVLGLELDAVGVELRQIDQANWK